MRELGPCIICRQKLSNPRNLIWKLRLDGGDGIVDKKSKNDFRQSAEQEFFHVDCLRCKSSSFVILVPGPFRAKAIIQTLTDLTKDDLSNINALQEIDSNEVLAFHRFLTIN